jgi:DUF917 family protein
VAIFPDPIYLLEPGTGRGYMSVELRPGYPLVLLAAPAHPRLRAAAQTEAGQQAMSPERFGAPGLAYQRMETLWPE